MEMVEASNSTGRRGGEGEVRRVNVVYFLSRNGRVEHPHLLRVRRLHRDPVRLRDVKRWLVEFRGNQVPDSFSWSYKRRYRGGYVWQDLRDDDLITPFSDDEYILKGTNDVLTPSMLMTPSEALEITRPATAVDGALPPPLEQDEEASSDEPKHDDDGRQKQKQQQQQGEEGEKGKKAASLVGDSNNSSKRVAEVLCLCNILGCKTARAVEAADDDALRPVSQR